tara:strand:- start:7 stop:249 length:243 start_codon:yes stop_codon:yes gene_type:complete
MIVDSLLRAGGQVMGFLGGIRGPELILILVIVMIIFGVGRLPEIGGALGKAIRQFKSSVSDKTELQEEHNSSETKENSSS